MEEGEKTKVCTKCGEEKPVNSFYRRSDTGRPHSYCVVCKRAAVRKSQRTASPFGMSRKRVSDMRHKYGIEPVEYLTRYATQAGRCLICGKNFAAAGLGEHAGRGGQQPVLVVEHEHATGKVRGLVCHDCNHLVGFMEKQRPYVLKALRYIRGELVTCTTELSLLSAS